MARKTKEDAEITRQAIIEAAREVFLTKGVSKTTLEQIAARANVTRGAVYWHFKNKSELFNAMREQVLLPLIDRLADNLPSTPENDSTLPNPLFAIEHFLQRTIQTLNDCQATRDTYEILMTKCEYVGELAPVSQQIRTNCDGIISKFESAYKQAQQQELVSKQVTAEALALNTHLFFSGLLHMWVKDSDGMRFRNQAQTLISTHMNLLRK